MHDTVKLANFYGVTLARVRSNETLSRGSRKTAVYIIIFRRLNVHQQCKNTPCFLF